MREYLIKLYCSIGEIQRQKESSEAEKLRKQIDNMKTTMNALKEENMNLRKELDVIKKKITESTPKENCGNSLAGSNINKDNGKNSRENSSAVKRTASKKRNS